MRYAVIDGDRVTNVIVADSGFTLDGLTLVELGARETVAPGWTYRGELFQAPDGQVTPALDSSPSSPAPAATPPTDDVLAQIEALQSWATQMQAQFDALQVKSDPPAKPVEEPDGPVAS